jgi:AcrR family transcriptional regulator
MNETIVSGERDTKTRILDAAERLMGEAGLDVPLRAITAEAGVNLAAVNYHFQSKDALLDAVLARRIGPVNDQRLAMLDDLEARYPEGPLPLEPIIEALLAPVFHPEGVTHLLPLFGKVYSAPKEFYRRVFTPHLAGIVERFSAAFHRAAPELPQKELLWRMYFLVGIMVHVMNWSPLLDSISGGLISASDKAAVVERIVVFAAAGFRSPAPVAKGGQSDA